MGNAEQDWISDLVHPIGEDLSSGAAELALRGIVVFQSVMSESESKGAEALKSDLTHAAIRLVKCQPAMAPIFHLANSVLIAIDSKSDVKEIVEACQSSLDDFERSLCESAAKIADMAFDLIEPGCFVFAYSFSSTVVSALLNARAKGRYFRVACTEARPSLEGRKFAARLSAGGIEVVHTFDNAMGLVLANCAVAFMGCDGIARPGVVNKVGSWLLAVGCRELGIPLYALSGTEKFVGEDRLFEFEKHHRPGAEVWEDAPRGISLLNNQYDLVPFSLISGLVTERGILEEKDVAAIASSYTVHDALKLETAAF
ncbi:MAG: hypothetical protein KC777_17135 [Cyanobacteria bacterium HKST-UBA02]|nr:hypothetical protein [Cyanobacteria bacterium HKST-UBA02]